jgi:hypothetical protein
VRIVGLFLFGEVNMKIGLHDAEREHMPKKSFPNFALMKISAYHKARGETVEWWDYQKNNKYDIVYSSKVFDFTPENPNLPPSAIKGGTGYGLYDELPKVIDSCKADYSIYPTCDYAIGFLTRGCPNKCGFCVVPTKEGNIRTYANWRDIVRPDSNKLILMDNNILACEYGIQQLAELSETEYQLDINQGMDARLFDERVANICSRIKWIRFLRFSCDSIGQISAVENAINLLKARGIKPYRVFVYLLVTSDLDDAVNRVECLKRHKGINLYAQAERNPLKGITTTPAQLEFAQRYIYRGVFRKETWVEYCNKRELPFI